MNSEQEPHPAPQQGKLMRLSNWMFQRPRTVLLMLLVLLVLPASQLHRLRFESGMDVFYDPSSNLRHILDEVNEHFVNDEFIFILYRSEELFSLATMQTVRQLGEQLEALKVTGDEGDFFPVDQVTSLTTVKDLEGSEFSFQTVALVPDPLEEAEWNAKSARQRVEDNPLLKDGFLSDDGKSALLVVRLTDDIDDPQRNFLVQEIRKTIAAIESDKPDLTFFVAGGPIFNTDMADYQAQDLIKFIPIGYALMALLVFFFVRRLKGLGFAILAISCCFMLGVGVLAAIGGSLNNCSVMLPPIMMALTAAMLLHFFSEFAKNAHHHGLRHPQRQTVGELLEPSVIAALTTAVGFAALAVSHVPAVHKFGIAASIAVILSFFVVVLLFVFVTRYARADSLIAPNGFAVSPRIDAALGAMASWVQRWHWPLLFCCLLYALLIGYGISRVVVDNNVVGMFDPSAPVRQATEEMDNQIGGTSILVVSLRHTDAEHFLEPAVLKKIDQLSDFMRRELGVSRTTSATDFIKLMHRGFYNNQAEAFRIPDNAAQTAQLLLLNGDTRLEEYIDESHQWVRIEARSDLHSSSDLNDCYLKLEQYLAANFPAASGYRADATGLARLEADMVNQLISSQVKGFSLSAMIIFAVMILLFRSFKVGLLCLWPNMFPITSNLGLMGWLGIRLDASTVMISSVALGIAVDDTVHFVQWARHRLSEHGDLPRAIRETFHVKGPAIIWTSVVISMGFCVSLVSNFSPTRNFGILICISMITAVVGDLILLPTLMLCLKSRLGLSSPKQEKSSHEDA